MRDNKTEYHDRFRDYGVGEKVFRTFVTESDDSRAESGRERKEGRKDERNWGLTLLVDCI